MSYQIPLVVPGMIELEQEFHQVMQHYVKMAIVNTPEYISGMMAKAITESFYSGTTRDFDMLVTYCTELVTPNEDVSFSDIYITAMSEYSEESGLLDHDRIGHSCGLFCEDDSVLAHANKNNDTVVTCPGCILAVAYEKAFSYGVQAAHMFHTAVSELYHRSQAPDTYYVTTHRHGDLFMCNEVVGVYDGQRVNV